MQDSAFDNDLKLPCLTVELAQHFIDAQTGLGDIYRSLNCHPDINHQARESVRQRLVSLNPGVFPYTPPQTPTVSFQIQRLCTGVTLVCINECWYECSDPTSLAKLAFAYYSPSDSEPLQPKVEVHPSNGDLLLVFGQYSTPIKRITLWQYERHLDMSSLHVRRYQEQMMRQMEVESQTPKPNPQSL